MLDSLFILGLSLLAFAVGLRWLDALGARPLVAFDAVALATPLGLGTVGLATLALGEVGALNRPALATLLAVAAIVVGRQGWSRGAGVLRETVAFDRPRTLQDATFWLATLATVLGTYLTALAPVTDGDALCYHLQVPKVFLTRGGVGFDPDLHETIYPLLTELLYAVALAFRGPVACRLVQWVLGLVFAANVTALARPSLGSRAWWAGSIALLVPAVSNGMSAPLNDVALAAFGTAAVVAFTRVDARSGVGSVVLVGVLAGMAIGVKYPALVLVGLLGLSFVGASVFVRGESSDPAKIRFRRGVSNLALFGFATLLVGGVWYLRAWFHTGNPVFPFFRHLFGGAGLDEVLDPIKRPLAVTGWNLLTALVPLTLQPDRFDSFSHQFGPVFLLLLPGLLLERTPRRVGAIVALGFAFLILCLTQRQSMRFVLIAVGPMAVGVAWLVSTWADRRTVPCRLLILMLAAMLGFEATLAAARARHGLNVVVGRETVDHYLSRREPTYRVGKWVAENLPPTARIVGQDHRGYYFPCDYTMELAHRRRTGLGRRGETAEAVVETLRRRGFSHVMFCPPVPERAVEFDPTLGVMLAEWAASRPPLYREELADADDVVRRYAIYSLAEPLATGPESRSRR